MRSISLIVSLIVVSGLVVLTYSIACGQTPPFGGSADVDFAEKAWSAIDGYDEWKLNTAVYPGQSPHGKFLRMFYNVVTIEGEPYHVIVKDNYGGEAATETTVTNNPEAYLAAVTIMLQREPGYDPENNDWFWAKYLKNGDLDMTNGMKMAGRVAKGSNQGCIACHANAGGGDYVFTNDE